MPIYEVTATVEPSSVTYRIEADSLEEAQDYMEEIAYSDIVEVHAKGIVSNDQETEADFEICE